jgi:hypothetical protein
MQPNALLVRQNFIICKKWVLQYFDRSACEDGCGIDILLVLPRGVTYSFSIRLPAPCTNNLAEFEAVCRGWSYLLKPVRRQ